MDIINTGAGASVQQSGEACPYNEKTIQNHINIMGLGAKFSISIIKNFIDNGGIQFLEPLIPDGEDDHPSYVDHLVILYSSLLPVTDVDK